MAAGCSDGDDDGEGGGGGSADDYVDAISDTFGDEAESDEATECVARAYVEAIGVDAFEDAGVSPQDIRDNPDSTPEEMGLELSEDQLTEITETASDCPGLDG